MLKIGILIPPLAGFCTYAVSRENLRGSRKSSTMRENRSGCVSASVGAGDGENDK